MSPHQEQSSDQRHDQDQPRLADQIFHLDDHLLRAALLEALDCLNRVLHHPCPDHTRHLAHQARLRLTYFLGQFRVPGLDQATVLRLHRASQSYLVARLAHQERQAHQLHQGRADFSPPSPTSAQSPNRN